MPFVDFLKATVLTSAGAATALGLVTVAGTRADGVPVLIFVAVGWWVLAGLIGALLGRRTETTPPIARLLAGARSTSALPEQQPARILLNRLWPLLLCSIGAGALAFVAPQVPAIACGFTIIGALAWRRQDRAVTAIEERDGARFYVTPTSPFRSIQLVRAPGFRTLPGSLAGVARGGAHHERNGRATRATRMRPRPSRRPRVTATTARAPAPRPRAADGPPPGAR